MSTFDEQQHPRAGDGKFTAKGLPEAVGGTDVDLGVRLTTGQIVTSSVVGRHPSGACANS